MTTGEKIKYYRQKLKLTQEELGSMVGVQKAAINKYETGIVVNLKQSTIAALANALGISPVELLSDSTIADSKEEKFLVTAYRSLLPRGKELLIERASELTVLYGKKSENEAYDPVQEEESK